MDYIIFPAMALMAFVGNKFYNSFEVPHSLKDLPSIPFYSVLYAYFMNEPYDKCFSRLYHPALRTHGHARIWSQGRWELVLSDSDDIREVLSSTDQFTKLKKSSLFTPPQLIQKVLGFENVVASDGVDWRRHRSVVNPAFKRSYPTQMFGDCVMELIDKIRMANYRPVKIHELFQRMTLDVLGRGMFNHNFGAMKGEIKHEISIYNQVISGIFNPIYQSFPILEYYLPPRRALYHKGGEFRSFLLNIIQKRRNEGLPELSDAKDLLSLMVKDLESESPKLSSEDVINNLAVFSMVGHQTTCNNLTTIFYYLARHQDIQAKARSEVSLVLGNPATVKVPDTEQLKVMHYIDAIIKESMRLVTTVPQLRRYSPNQIKLSSGLVIPGDAYLNLSLWGLHHDNNIFPHPHSFHPERLMNPSSLESKLWMPTGGGARMCAGQNFTMMEQRIVIAILLQRYTWHLPSSSPSDGPIPKLNAAGLIHMTGVELKFVERV